MPLRPRYVTLVAEKENVPFLSGKSPPLHFCRLAGKRSLAFLFAGAVFGARDNFSSTLETFKNPR